MTNDDRADIDTTDTDSDAGVTDHSTGAVATAALAVDTIYKLLDLAGGMFPLNHFNVLITITNNTAIPLEPLNSYAAHGKLLALQSLPVIPPAVKAGAPDPYLFPASFFVGSRENATTAPAVLCQWKMAGRNVYLMVFMYAAGGTSDHAGFFGLYEKPVDLKDFWDNAVEGKDWYYYGDVAKKCDATKFGLRVTGSLSNDNPGSFVIKLHDA